MTIKTMPVFCPSCRLQRPRAEVRLIARKPGGNGGVLRIYRCVHCIAKRSKAAHA